MAKIQEFETGPVTFFAGRNEGGDESYEVHAGKKEDEEIFALNPSQWQADEDGYVDYALYVHETMALAPGEYTVSFTSSDSGDYFYDLIEGHVTDPRILRAYAIQDSEGWWNYDGKVIDPNHGVDDFEYGPNLDEAILIKIS